MRLNGVKYLKCHACPARVMVPSSRTKITIAERRIGWIKDNEGYLCHDCSLRSGLRRDRNCCNKSKIDRDEAVGLWLAGATMAELGRRYGVTRERVRQVLSKACVDPGKRSRSCRDYGVTIKSRFRCEECQRRRARARMMTTCQCGASRSKISGHCHRCAGAERRLFDYELAAALYRAGYGGRSIAVYFGVHNTAVFKALETLSVECRPKFGRGHIEPTEPIERAAERALPMNRKAKEATA